MCSLTRIAIFVIASVVASFASPADMPVPSTQGDNAAAASAGHKHDANAGGGVQSKGTHDEMMKMMERHHAGASTQHGGASPTMPGQDAFGAIQEIVAILDADPTTDWTKVDLEALRQHLIDMNEVALNAVVVARTIDGGLAITITGRGRTVGAIQRMVPAHARAIDASNGWHAKATLVPSGATFIVTSPDPRQAQRIRGLGFIGVMATGAHHQEHHLAIARGEPPHPH